MSSERESEENSHASKGQTVNGVKNIEIGWAIATFAEHIASLHSTFFLSSIVVQAGRESAHEKLRLFGKQHGINWKEEDGRIEVTFRAPHAGHAKTLFKSVRRSQMSARLVPRSFVVALVSEFDAFLGRLLRALFVKKPELLAPSDRMIALSELLGFESIEAARDSLLDKEIESIIRKSHDEQFNWMENRFDLTLRKDLPAWKTFIEVTERRNLFVHSDGIVSQQYINVCRSHGVDLPADVRKGSALYATEEYFVEAYRCIYEVGVKLGHVVWRKILSADREEADDHLNALAYELLVEHEYQLAATLLDFACHTLKSHASIGSRLTFVINRAQAYKWLGDDEKSRSIIDREDWSAYDPKFVLASHVLRDDYEKAAAVMRSLGAKGGISEANYESWPLFRKFREAGSFLDAFREVFGKDFTTIEERLQLEEGSQSTRVESADSVEDEDAGPHVSRQADEN